MIVKNSVDEVTIIYGIQKYEGPISFFYPEPFIAEVRKGIVSYITKLATYEIISSFNIEITDTIHEKLLSICQESSLYYLENKYQKKNKKHIPFSIILEDPIISKAVLKYTDLKLAAFLEELSQNQMPIYFEVGRNIYLPDIKYQISKDKLIPKLMFTKKDNGTDYYLKVLLKGSAINLQKGIVEVLSNKNPWLLHDYNLYFVENINGNKLKPFIKNEKIFIPEKLTKTYFEKFILSVIGKLDVEVEGFTVIENSLPGEIEFRIIENFATGVYELEVRFQYGKSFFSFGDQGNQRVSISFDKNDAIEITLNKRDVQKENEIVENQLYDFFDKTPAKRFVLKESQDKFALFAWLVEHKNKCIENGITIPAQSINNINVSLEKYHLDFNYTSKSDWFDLHAVIKVGDQELNYFQLMEHIKNDNRLFKMENGEIFVIPEDWMKRFQQIAKFAEMKNRSVKLSKSNYTLLEHELLSFGGSTVPIIKHEDIEFEVPSSLQATLRNYQKEGVLWLATHYANKLGACLADDMGLGKTLQTITILLYAKEQIKDRKTELNPIGKQVDLFATYDKEQKPLRSLVVVPSSLVYNWEFELKKFAPSLMTYKHIGPKRSKNSITLKTYDVIITTYQTVLRDEGLLKKVEFEYIILDECQYIKNRNSKIFSVLKDLKSNYKISLSGTPIENSLADLWSQMEFINNDILGSFPFFKKHFMDPIEKENDEDAIAELKILLEPFILRRTKGEVLTDLPELLEQTIYCEMSSKQSKLYDQEKSKIRNFLLTKDYRDPKIQFHVFAALLKLRQWANHPSLIEGNSDIESGKFEVISNTITSLTKAGHKLLIFSSFKGHLKLVESYLNKNSITFTSLTGDHSTSQRDHAVATFNNDEKCSVFLISLKAGGVGLNLTAANYVLILDPWWNPFAEKQAIARAHRIGQENKVNVIRFISKDSIEEKIQLLQASKLRLADNFIETGDFPKLDQNEVFELLQ